MGSGSVKVASALLAGSTADVIEKAWAELATQLGAPATLVTVFASTGQNLGEIVAALSGPSTVAVGASTAGEFIEGGDAKGSVAIFGLASDQHRASAGIGLDLAKNPSGAIAAALDGQPRELRGYPHRTAIALLDPLAGNGEEVALMLAGELGPDQPLAGGAAGDDLRMTETQVACGERVASNALVVAQLFSKEPLGIGVSHGHRPLSRPLTVTRATGGYVHEIEGRPAWDVWREETRDAARARGIDVDKLAAENEGSFLLQFEAGLANGVDFKIRAPLSRRQDGSILFAAAIPEGAVIRVTQGDAQSQIASAVTAAERARAALGDKPIAGALVFDCICRNLILGSEFGHAVRAVSRALGGVKLAGFETYGEVALSAGDMSGFHNTTSVVLAFPR